MGRRPDLLSCFFKSRANVPVRERPSGFAAGKAAKRQACCGSNKHIRRKQQGFNWIMRICCLCKLNRGLQNLEFSRKGNEFILFASAKRTKKQPGLRPATSVQNSMDYVFFVLLPFFVPKPACVATRFFGCFEPVRKGCCTSDARLMFFENRMLYSKLTRRNVFKKGSCSLSLLRWEFVFAVC